MELAVELWQEEVEIVQSIINSGIDINYHVNDNNDTILHDACSSDNVELVLLLLANGADMNKQNKEGYTPLHCACYIGSLGVVKIFLERPELGANFELRTIGGRTPFDVASIVIKDYIIAHQNISEIKEPESC